MSPASASASVSPPPSRISTGVACEECRRRKSKCDRVRPQCGTCEDIGAACVFPEKRMQRGPKKGQMNALRTRIATLERQLQKDQSRGRGAGEADTDGTFGGLMGADMFLDMPRPRLPPMGFDGGLLDGNIGGFMTGGEFYREMAQMSRSASSNGHQSDSSPFDAGLNLTNLMRADLDELYFERVYPVAPIIHRRLYTTWQSPTSSPSASISPAKHALQHAMWSVAAAVSTQFRHLAEPLATEARRVLDSLSSHGEEIQLERIQAWLMLAHYDALCKSEHEATVTAGRAIRLVQLAKLHDIDAQDVAAHGFGSNSGVSTPEMGNPVGWGDGDDFARVEERRRAFWLAYWVDRFWLMRSDWPLSIQDDLIYTRLPAPESNFQSSNPIAMAFLSTALTSSSHTALPPFAECIVLDFLFGRCIVHQRLAPSASFLRGDRAREFWRMRAWLVSMCDRRSQMLSAAAEVVDATAGAAGMAADPMYVFAYSFVKFMKMYLATTAGPEGEGQREMVQSVEDLAGMARTMPRFGSFKAHPFLPSLLYRAALIVTTHAKSRISDPGTSESLNAALTAIVAALKNLQEVSNLARVLLLELDQQLAQ